MSRFFSRWRNHENRKGTVWEADQVEGEGRKKRVV
jgi:hypothetical protein